MVLLSFDIKGAFNAAWWQKAITELRKKLDITSLLGTLENYFDQRFVEVSYGTLVLQDTIYSTQKFNSIFDNFILTEIVRRDDFATVISYIIFHTLIYKKDRRS